MKCLVTGGAGFIGSHIVDALFEAGHEVVVVDDLSTGKRANLNPHARFYEMDIRSPELPALFAREKPDVVSHQAAQMDVRRAVREPAFDASVNVIGALNVLESARHSGVQKILLTASGGPFRNAPLADLANVTPEQACAHPNWVMGRKISVDSATMMNKGLEVIEAHWLFAAPPEMIQVVVHPQSVIHSAVQYADGSVLAQMGNPDMRTPIAYAMAWPERIAAGVEALDLFKIARLDFFAPDFERFRGLQLAYDVLREGGTAPAILNAANEIAVAAFLEGRLPFLAIARLNEAVLEALPAGPEGSLADVLAADAEARRLASQLIQELRFA